ncbi:MAG TPA: hypothetical protein VF024_16275, partial [Solirubrobacteraceae bacterium]
ARVVRGEIAEGAIVGALGTAVGIAAGRVVLSWVIGGSMAETMPDIGALVSVAPFTYALAILAGTVIVAAAPLLTVRRLRRTDVPATLRVVE